MMQSSLTLKRHLTLAMVTVTGALGDTFLAVGMKRLGPVSLGHPGLLIAALRTPWVIGGTLLLIGFFASYLTALTWADLTFVLPATSLSYAIVALLSEFWLHEQISVSRWIGIALITAGVGFVAQGPAYTSHAEDRQTLPAGGPGVERG